MSTPSRKVVDLASLTRTNTRGRKSTVTQADIDDARALEIGEGMLIEEYSLNGPEFTAYRAERINRYHGDEAALLNAWASRYRQRVAALAKASGVDLIMVTDDNGDAYAGRRS